MKRKKRINILLSSVLILSVFMNLFSTLAFADTAAQPANQTYQVVNEGGSEARADNLVKVSKTISGTDTENVFDITLKVETKERLQTQLEAADTAVVIVMDISQTMNNRISSTDSTSRYSAAMTAAESFLDTFQKEAAKHTDISYRVGYVAFNRDAHQIFPLSSCYTTEQKAALVSDMQTDTKAIIKRSGYATAQDRWTNIEAGLKMAKDMLSSAGEQHKYVIFLSDGFPTTYLKEGYTGWIPTMNATYNPGWTDTKAIGQDGYFYNLKTNQLCTAGTSYSDKAATKGETMAASMRSLGMKIYSIGVGLGQQQIGGENGYAGFVVDCYPTGTPYVIGADTDGFKEWLKTKIASGYYYDSYDTDALTDAYENIFKDIQKTNEESIKTAWISSDPMSSTAFSKVEFLKFYNKAGQLVDGNLTNPEGQKEENEANLVNNNGIDEISWDLKHSVYDMTKEGNETLYTYTLKYRVRLSNEVSDFETGKTYETNGVTKLTYRINKNGLIQPPETLYYPLPSAKGYLGEFDFYKVNSKTKEPVVATFTLTHKSNCSACSEIYDSKVVTIAAAEATADTAGIVSFSNIPSGHEYVLKEKVAVAGYEANTEEHAVVVSYGQVTVDGKPAVTKTALEALAETSTSDASFTTVENVPLNKLTITKDVAGDRDESYFKEGAFEFTITNTSGTFEKKVSLPVKHGDSLSWTITEENLPADTYLVTETGCASGGEGYDCKTEVTYPKVDGQAQTSVSLLNGDEKTVGVTNTYTYYPDSTNFTAYKEWDDSSNQDGIRPVSVRFALLANGIKVPDAEKDVTTSVEGEPEKYSVTFTYDKIKYKGEASVKEVGYTDENGYHPFDDEVTSVPEYDLQVVSSDTIKNIHEPLTTQLKVEKIWGDGTKGREKPVTIRLYANDVEVASTVLKTASGISEYTFTQTKDGQPLYQYSQGNKITYTITEDELGYGYYQKIESTESGWKITNTYSVYIPPTIEKTVTKVWNDSDNQDGTRPVSVTIQLYENGTPKKTTVLSEANNWTYTFTGLLATSSFTVEEVSVPEGYSASISEGNDSFLIVNTYEPKEEVPKEEPKEEPKGEKPAAGDSDNKPGKDQDEDGDISDANAVPQTSDESNALFWILIAVASGSLLLMLNIPARKNSK